MQRERKRTSWSAGHHCVAFQASCASIPSHGTVVDQRQPGEDHGPAWLPSQAGSWELAAAGSWQPGPSTVGITILNPHPQPPIPIPIPIPIQPHSSGTMTQTGPLPRLACEHVPASVPEIRKPVTSAVPQSTVHGPQPAAHSIYHSSVLWARSHAPPAAPHPVSRRGDQALIPSEYSDGDVESLPLGGGTWALCAVPMPVPGLAGPPPASPSYPSTSSRPKAQVPGSEVEMWLARQGTSRARRPRGLHLGWGPIRSVGTGGCARIDDAAFHFPIPPPLPRPALSGLCLAQRPLPAWLPWLPWLPWHPWFSLVLGPGSSFTN
jgi:hypothetical protein